MNTADPAPVQAAMLAAVVAELERKVKRSMSGIVLIAARDVKRLADLVQALNPRALESARRVRALR